MASHLLAHLQPLQCRAFRIIGLDSQKASKLAMRLHAHSVQFAFELVRTKCALEKTHATARHQGQKWDTAGHSPDPHRLPYLSQVSCRGTWP